MSKKNSLTIKCPRCGEVCFKTQKKCSDCGLIFERLNYVTNRAGKIAVVRREKEKILRVTNWPTDVKKSKALLLCGFFGIFGVHNFYLGRYVKGFFSLIVTLVACVCLMLENVIDYSVFYSSFFFLPTGIMVIFWWSDFVLIALNKYKIPVAIDTKMFHLYNKETFENLDTNNSIENQFSDEVNMNNVVNINEKSNKENKE